MEGGLRTPFMMRWPGRIPAGRGSDEIVHEVDVYTTLARAAGAALPTDRAIDGVDQLAFFQGAQARSAREGFPVFMGTQVRAVKWHEWKLHYAWQDEPTLPAQPIMKLFNLRSDPKEETDVKDLNPWAESLLGKVVEEFNASLDKYPLIPLGTPDPYEAPRTSLGHDGSPTGVGLDLRKRGARVSRGPGSRSSSSFRGRREPATE
jgi:arylsulfatase